MCVDVCTCSDMQTVYVCIGGSVSMYIHLCHSVCTVYASTYVCVCVSMYVCVCVCTESNMHKCGFRGGGFGGVPFNNEKVSYCTVPTSSCRV